MNASQSGVSLTEGDKRILRVIREAGKALTPKEVSSADDELNYNYMRQRLPTLVGKGVLASTGDGYNLPERVEKDPVDIDTPKSEQDVTQERGQVTVPLLSISAAAGKSSTVWDVQIQRYMSVDRAVLAEQTGGDVDDLAVITATGNSMETTIRAGDKLVIRRHTNGARLVEGGIYVWRSAHRGVIIKRVHWEEGDTLRLVSDNENYPDIVVKEGDTQRWQCIGHVKRVMRAV